VDPCPRLQPAPAHSPLTKPHHLARLALAQADEEPAIDQLRKVWIQLFEALQRPTHCHQLLIILGIYVGNVVHIVERNRANATAALRAHPFAGGVDQHVPHRRRRRGQKMLPAFPGVAIAELDIGLVQHRCGLQRARSSGAKSFAPRRLPQIGIECVYRRIGRHIARYLINKLCTYDVRICQSTSETDVVKFTTRYPVGLALCPAVTRAMKAAIAPAAVAQAGVMATPSTRYDRA